MAEQTVRERLQPCLLDRLTDDEPHTQVESRDKRIMSPAQVRKSVLRDLSWLFNCGTRLDEQDAAEFPSVASSVLNFGIPDLCGFTATSVSTAQMERMLTEVIQRFEPRIYRRGLQVRAVVDHSAFSHNAIVFEIHGQVWAQPLPERLDVKTEVDLETGQVSISEGGASTGPGSAGGGSPAGGGRG